MNQSQKEISKLLQTHFKQEKPLPPVEWVEKFVRLSSKQSIHTGRYSLKRTPYFKQILEDLVNPEIRTVTFKKPAQIGASQLAAVIVLYYVANKTLPVAIIFPSQDMAQQFNQRALFPCIETCKPVADLKTGNIHDLKASQLTFKSCAVKLIGGGSANKLSSNPLAFVLVDEASKYADLTDEADAISLARDRTISFQETREDKIFITSTPKVKGSCVTTDYFEKGSQDHYYIPCPHCKTYQTLEFNEERVKFQHCKEGEKWNYNRVLKETFYLCPHCEGKITDDHKADFLNAGHWKSHNPDAPKDTKSYTLSALYSLSLTFGAVARHFLEAEGDITKLQDFYNSWLGKEWIPFAATVSESAIDSIIERSPEYYRGEIPGEPRALILTVDSQQSTYPYMITALMKGGASAVVEYDIASSMEDIQDIRQLSFVQRGTSNQFNITHAIQDAGAKHSEVYQQYFDTGGAIVPCLGRGLKEIQMATTRLDFLSWKGQRVPVMKINDKILTDLLLLSVLKGRGKDQLWLPKDTEDSLKKHLSAVSSVEKKDKRGFKINEFKYSGKWDLFDCLKYYYGLAHYLEPQLQIAEAQAENLQEQPSSLPEPTTYNLWN